jgi:hypothetical protein
VEGRSIPRAGARRLWVSWDQSAGCSRAIARPASRVTCWSVSSTGRASRVASRPHPSRAVDELADLLEVVYAIADHVGIDLATLERVRAARHAERGGFTRWLVRHDLEPDSPADGPPRQPPRAVSGGDRSMNIRLVGRPRGVPRRASAAQQGVRDRRAAPALLLPRAEPAGPRTRPIGGCGVPPAPAVTTGSEEPQVSPPARRRAGDTPGRQRRATGRPGGHGQQDQTDRAARLLRWRMAEVVWSDSH